MDRKTMEETARHAGEINVDGLHCSECVMIALSPLLLPGLDERAVKMATPFGGGIGLTHNDLCGAYTAGVMLIGGVHGRTGTAVDDALCQGLALEFRKFFMDDLGHVVCSNLREYWGKAHGRPCAILLERASLRLLELLEEAKDPAKAEAIAAPVRVGAHYHPPVVK